MKNNNDYENSNPEEQPNTSSDSNTDDLEVYSSKEFFTRQRNKPKKKPGIIESFLYPGLTTLSGYEKVGKSILTRQMAVAIRLGEKLFGKFSTQEAGVLYSLFEGDEEEIGNHFRLMFENRGLDVNDNYNLHIKIPSIKYTIGDDLEEYIRFYNDKIIDDLKLVILDPLGRIMPSGISDSNDFTENYSLFGGLNELALELDINILIVHHLRKTESANPYNQVLGSKALTAAATTNWILSKRFHYSKGKLMIVGRKMADKSYELYLNPDTLEWEYSGEKVDLGLTPDKQQIVDLLFNNSNKEMKSGKIAEAVDKSDKTTSVSTLLGELVKDGILVSPSYSWYKLDERIYSKMKEGGE